MEEKYPGLRSLILTTVLTQLVCDVIRNVVFGLIAASSRRPLVIDHPWNAEPVDQHAKPASPKSLTDRHLNHSTFAQLAKCARLLPDHQLERSRKTPGV
jgi:hypothetical protein